MLFRSLVAEFAFDEGTGYGATFSGTDAAPIVVKDESLITKTEGGIWQKITELFAAIRFERWILMSMYASENKPPI